MRTRPADANSLYIPQQTKTPINEGKINRVIPVPEKLPTIPKLFEKNRMSSDDP